VRSSTCRALLAASCAGALSIAWAAPSAAQTRVRGTAELSADTVRMGDAFRLVVRLTVPPGRALYVPDMLPGTVFVESLSPVEITAVPSADAGASVTLTYPMIAFGAGLRPVPGFDAVSTSRAGSTGRMELPGGSAIGEWEAAPPASDPAVTVTRLPRRDVWVVPVFTAEDYVEGVEPRPAADVLGGSWSWPTLALMALCSTLLLGTVVSVARDWTARTAEAEADDPEAALDAARRVALGALDGLIAEAASGSAPVDSLYLRASGVLRRYVEGFDRAWRPSDTTTELMAKLVLREAGGGVEPLVGVLRSAEAVKFGRRRPSRSAAATDLAALRTWVAGSGSPVDERAGRGDGHAGSPRATS